MAESSAAVGWSFLAAAGRWRRGGGEGERGGASEARIGARARVPLRSPRHPAPRHDSPHTHKNSAAALLQKEGAPAESGAAADAAPRAAAESARIGASGAPTLPRVRTPCAAEVVPPCFHSPSLLWPLCCSSFRGKPSRSCDTLGLPSEDPAGRELTAAASRASRPRRRAARPMQCKRTRRRGGAELTHSRRQPRELAHGRAPHELRSHRH